MKEISEYQTGNKTVQKNNCGAGSRFVGTMRKVGYLGLSLCFLLKKWLSFECVDWDKEKNVLFIMPKFAVGDAVLSLSMLSYALDFFKGRGAHVYLAADEGTIKFLKSIGYRQDYTWLGFHTGAISRESFRDFSQRCKKIQSIPWEEVIFYRELSRFEKGILMGGYYRRVLGRETPGFSANWKQCILDHFLDNYVKAQCEDDTMLYETQKQIFREILGDRNYFSKQAYISPIIAGYASIEKPYCVICGSIGGEGHTMTGRKWPEERFAEVADFIARTYALKIVLVGTKEDEACSLIIFHHMKEKAAVIDLTGKTSFAEWIEIIRHAKFYFGNDSGGVHVAAAVRTRSFFIMGYWNYGRFYPYRLDEQFTEAPVMIKGSCPDCTMCSLYNKRMTETRMQCDRLVREKGIYKCIDDISAEDAIRVLKEHLDEKYLRVR